MQKLIAESFAANVDIATTVGLCCLEIVRIVLLMLRKTTLSVFTPFSLTGNQLQRETTKQLDGRCAQCLDRSRSSALKALIVVEVDHYQVDAYHIDIHYTRLKV